MPSKRVEQEAMVAAQALEEAAKEPGRIKDQVIVRLEQLLEWVKKQQEPDYGQLKADLKKVQE